MKKNNFFLGFIALCILAGHAASATGYKITTTIPGTAIKQGGAAPTITAYVANLWIFGLLAGGVLAFIMIVWGAIEWTVSAGSQSKIEDAKDRIYQAIIGLVLLFGAYLVLGFINPNLVKLGKIQKFLDSGIEGVKQAEGPVSTVSVNLCGPRLAEYPPGSRIVGDIILVPGAVAGSLVAGPGGTVVGGVGGYYLGVELAKLFQFTGEDECIPIPSVVSIQNVQESGGGVCPSNAPYNGKCYLRRDLVGTLTDLAAEIDCRKGRSCEWEVVEAFPPRLQIRSSCHFDGTCVDIALVKSDYADVEASAKCANVKKLEDFIVGRTRGIRVINLYADCGGEAAEKIIGGGHFHLELAEGEEGLAVNTESGICPAGLEKGCLRVPSDILIRPVTETEIPTCPERGCFLDKDLEGLLLSLVLNGQATQPVTQPGNPEIGPGGNPVGWWLTQADGTIDDPLHLHEKALAVDIALLPAFYNDDVAPKAIKAKCNYIVALTKAVAGGNAENLKKIISTYPETEIDCKDAFDEGLDNLFFIEPTPNFEPEIGPHLHLKFGLKP